MATHKKNISRMAAAAALATLLLCGCSGRNQAGSGSSGTSDKAKITLGFLVKQPEEAWFQNEWKFAKRCEKKYEFHLETIGTTDGEKVLNAIDNLASHGAKGFVICTPDVKLGPAIIAKAQSHDMKVFTVDDQFVGADGKFMDVPYMGISAGDIGHQVGKAVWEEFKKRGWKLEETAVCAVTFEELNTSKERTDGAAEEMVKLGFPAAKIYRAQERTTDVPGALDAATVVLTQHPEVKRWLVFSMNDEGALGAVRAMENRGFTADTVIACGIGGTSALPEFKKDKPTGFFATCLISPRRHGYETTELLYKWVSEGKEPPKDTRTKGIIIHRDDCEKVMKEQGIID